MIHAKGLIFISDKMPVKLIPGRNFVIFFLKPPNKVKFEERNLLVVLVNLLCLLNLNSIIFF